MDESLMKKDYAKSIVVQGCLMICVENFLHKLLDDICLACKEKTVTIADHDCVSHEQYCFYLEALFDSTSRDQLKDMRDSCYTLFEQYSICFHEDLLCDMELGPFDGYFQLLLHQEDTLKNLKDIIAQHMKSNAPQVLDVMKVYYQLTDVNLCVLDLPDLLNL